MPLRGGRGVTNLLLSSMSQEGPLLCGEMGLATADDYQDLLSMPG
jgi:hypothetical protein